MEQISVGLKGEGIGRQGGSKRGECASWAVEGEHWQQEQVPRQHLRSPRRRLLLSSRPRHQVTPFEHQPNFRATIDNESGQRTLFPAERR